MISQWYKCKTYEYFFVGNRLISFNFQMKRFSHLIEKSLYFSTLFLNILIVFDKIQEIANF